VSRFKLGGGEGELTALQAGSPRPAAARKAAPAPIKFKADTAQLGAAIAAVALGTSQKASGHGEWKEF
ncbi:MAG: hypothetical protein ABI409_18860, partial [Ramlibacter sp.]